MRQIRIVIADDEQELRTYLKNKLAILWPEATVAGEAGDGQEALHLIMEARPDIVFLDIRMPVLSGIEVARRAVGGCLTVFVTSYDQYAVEAFENEAVDYLLKPVSEDRLAITVKRLKERCASLEPPPDLSALLERVSRALRTAPAYLQWIRVQHKEDIRIIPVCDVCYFKATDKYTTVRTVDGEFLIRKTLRELEGELDAGQFWRVHRAAIVNVKTIQSVGRSLTGMRTIKFSTIPDQLTVSRAYSDIFKQM